MTDEERTVTWTGQHLPRFHRMLQALRLDGGHYSVLDVGIDPPKFAAYVLSRHPEVSYQGVSLPDAGGESDRDTYRVTRLTVDLPGSPDGGRRIPVVKLNVERDRWPRADGSVDRVVMGAILEHLFDPAFALAEANRTLTEGGTLVLSTPNAGRLINLGRLMAGRSVWSGYAGEDDDNARLYHRHNREYLPGEVRELLDTAGFKIVGMDTVNLHRSGMAGSIYRRVASTRGAWSDQIVVAATPISGGYVPPETIRDRSVLYRDSVAAREADGD